MTLRPTHGLARAIATTIAAAATLAGCAGRSLNPPQVVEWSNGAQPTVTSVDPTPADRAALYTVRRDDTLLSIATRFNTTPANLATWNNLGPGTRVQVGQVLRVTPPGAPLPVDSSPVASTQPVDDGSIEQRPIGTAGPPPPQGMPPSSSTAPLKSGPIGVRRPYSDAALAELSRTEGDVAPPAASAPPTAPPTAPAPAAPAPSSATSVVSWAWPVATKPNGAFDDRAKGVDFVGRAGDPVLAAADGKVTFSGTGVRGYGKLVIVQHSPEFLSVYAHNRTNLVSEGAAVTKGQRIAEMGSTETDAVKLHFEIRRDSKPVDPLQYLPPR